MVLIAKGCINIDSCCCLRGHVSPGDVCLQIERHIRRQRRRSRTDDDGTISPDSPPKNWVKEKGTRTDRDDREISQHGGAPDCGNRY